MVTTTRVPLNFEIFLEPGHISVGWLVCSSAARRDSTAAGGQGDASFFTAGEGADLRLPGRQAQGIHRPFDLAVQAPQIARIDQILEATELIVDFFRLRVGERLAEAAAEFVVAVQDGLGGGCAGGHVAGHILGFVQLGFLRR